MTRTSIALNSSAHHGVYGSHMKLASMHRPASPKPTTRAQVVPVNRATPVRPRQAGVLADLLAALRCGVISPCPGGRHP